MDLVKNLLNGMTSDSSIEALKGKSGASSSQIESAVKSAIPTLIGSMTKNASSEDGAKSLLGALSQHKNTDSLSSQIKNADELDGAKILGKILGGNKDDFLKEIAKSSGLDIGQTNSVMSSIAPAILSSLSAATASEDEKKADLSSVGGFFKSIFSDDDKKDDMGSLVDILKKTIL